jgi:hypothetical protein
MRSIFKNAVFWDVAPCRSCVNRRFGGTYRLHIQGIKIGERGSNVSRWLHTADCNHLLTLVPRSRILPWRWRRYVPPKRRLTHDLHGATSQKTAFFIVTAVKTSKSYLVFFFAKWNMYIGLFIHFAPQCMFCQSYPPLLVLVQSYIFTTRHTVQSRPRTSTCCSIQESLHWSYITDLNPQIVQNFIHMCSNLG